MLKKLFPKDEKLLEKLQLIQENSVLTRSRSVFRSTTHVCNASLKKVSEKSLNDVSKFRSNISIKSSNPLYNSKTFTNTRGFSSASCSNFNFHKCSNNHKSKLHPLSESQKTQSQLEKALINENLNDKEINFLNNNLDNKIIDEHNREEDSKENSLNVDKQGLENENTHDKQQQNADNYKKLFSFKKENNNHIAEYSWNKPLSNTQMPVINNSLYKNIAINNEGQGISNKYSFNAIFDDKLKKKIMEKDIEKKLESYKIKLNTDMIKILKEEKLKEEEREKLYCKTTSEADKRRLESLISLERVQSSERILRLNE